MKIYINDIPVKIEHFKKVDEEKFDTIINNNKDIIEANLEGVVLINNASDQSVDKLLKLMTSAPVNGLTRLVFAVKDKKRTAYYVKSRFSIVKAAGGIVVKDDKILLIYRLKKWDLPKGKLEKKETNKEGAVREVEEETGVKVMLGEKITATWHTYIRNKKFVLKRTYWYMMDCLDDANMAPQESESIEQVKWMTADEVTEAMTNSYRTINSVIKKFEKKRASGASSMENPGAEADQSSL